MDNIPGYIEVCNPHYWGVNILLRLLLLWLLVLSSLSTISKRGRWRLGAPRGARKKHPSNFGLWCLFLVAVVVVVSCGHRCCCNGVNAARWRLLLLFLLRYGIKSPLHHLYHQPRRRGASQRPAGCSESSACATTLAAAVAAAAAWSGTFDNNHALSNRMQLFHFIRSRYYYPREGARLI